LELPIWERWLSEEYGVQKGDDFNAECAEEAEEDLKLGESTVLIKAVFLTTEFTENTEKTNNQGETDRHSGHHARLSRLSFSEDARSDEPESIHSCLCEEHRVWRG
jgi:hypothetical protein